MYPAYSPYAPPAVCVRFDEHGVHVTYAADLAESLHVPLLVSTSIPHGALAEEVVRRVRESVCSCFKKPHSALVSVVDAPLFQKGGVHLSIVVSCETGHKELPVLSPAGEKRVFRGKERRIFAPLGNGRSAFTTAKYALCLAEKLEAQVLFWHTTWAKKGLTSADPKDHVCAEAAEVLSQIEKLAATHRVKWNIKIDKAPTVVEGIVRTALREHASLIVMARGKRTRFGAYPDTIRERNCPIPLLILGREGE